MDHSEVLNITGPATVEHTVIYVTVQNNFFLLAGADLKLTNKYAPSHAV